MIEAALLGRPSSTAIASVCCLCRCKKCEYVCSQALTSICHLSMVAASHWYHLPELLNLAASGKNVDVTESTRREFGLLEIFIVVH